MGLLETIDEVHGERSELCEEIEHEMRRIGELTQKLRQRKEDAENNGIARHQYEEAEAHLKSTNALLLSGMERILEAEKSESDVEVEA